MIWVSAPSVPGFYLSDTLAAAYARCPSFTAMKRRGGTSTRATRLVSQRSSVEPAVTLFKLEDLDDAEPGPSTVRRSKRVKVEVKAEDIMDQSVNDVEASLVFANGAAASTNKVKRARATQMPRSESASPQKPKTIKQTLEKPHPAPAHWRETYDAIKKMRARFPAPVDTMGCDTAKWKETDPRVRILFSLSLIYRAPNLNVSLSTTALSSYSQK
jgi:endonuclease III